MSNSHKVSLSHRFLWLAIVIVLATLAGTIAPFRGHIFIVLSWDVIPAWFYSPKLCLRDFPVYTCIVESLFSISIILWFIKANKYSALFLLTMAILCGPAMHLLAYMLHKEFTRLLT